MKSFAFCFALIANVVQLSAQPWTATHGRDTTSFFPVGFYTFYICRGVPPFSYDPETGYPPTGDGMARWLNRDSANIAGINANYFVDWIPHKYWHLVDPKPPIKHDSAPFEDDIFRGFANRMGFYCDYKHNNDWIETDDIQGSVQRLVQHCPMNDEIGNAAWIEWYGKVDAELGRINRDVLPQSPYKTFYAAHEVDIYPDLQGASAEQGHRRRYALQYILHKWDEVSSRPDIKPFVVIGSVMDAGHSKIIDIANTCRNLRMIAWHNGALDPYIRTTYSDRKTAFARLTVSMDHFIRTFNWYIDFDRSKENLPLEFWFVGQSHKCYYVGNSDSALVYAARYPTYEELKLQAYLALSRGFKGIVWYTYGSVNANRRINDSPFGVVDSLRRPINEDLDIGMLPPHPCPEQVRPFDNVSRVNAELLSVGTIYKSLDFDTTFTQSTIPVNNSYGLHAVTAEGEHNDEALDISFFTGETNVNGGQGRYVMLVNKIINSTEIECGIDSARKVCMQFRLRGEVTLREQRSGRLLSGSYNCDSRCWLFTDSLMPGEGKLYEMHEVALDEGTVFCGEYLLQNYPNPSTYQTTIEYSIPYEMPVSLTVYNILGEIVDILVDEVQSAGVHRADCNAGALESGIYFYKLITPAGAKQRSMLIVR